MGLLIEKEGSFIKNPLWIVVGRCRTISGDSFVAKRAVKYMNVDHINRPNRK